MTKIRHDYPYAVTLKCDHCGKEFTARYYDDEVRISSVCNCSSDHIVDSMPYFGCHIIDGMPYSEWLVIREKERQEMLTELESIVDTLLDKNPMLQKQDNGGFIYNIYAPYDDRIDNETATRIITSDYPEDIFYEYMEEWYRDYESDCFENIQDQVLSQLKKDYAEYVKLLPDLEEQLEEYMVDMIFPVYPFDHYLKQKFNVPVVVDTGDGNYEFSLNSSYPSYYRNIDEPINDNASLVWLAEQQGYNKAQLWAALTQDGNTEKDKFLKSVKDEIADIPTFTQALIFLVQMSLEELIQINKLIKLQDEYGHKYDAKKRPYCGALIIDKNTTCGLYDFWNGGGSQFEIQLKHNLILPVRFIDSALPDGVIGYGVDKCYDFFDSVWSAGGIVELVTPLEYDMETA